MESLPERKPSNAFGNISGFLEAGSVQFSILFGCNAVNTPLDY